MDRWGTPIQYVDALDVIFPDGYLDPCYDPAGWTRPVRKHTEADDGLQHAWGGNVFCNPPYSKPGQWIDRALWNDGPVVLLIKLDPACRAWQPLLQHHGVLICLPSKRLRYIDLVKGESGGTAAFASAWVLIPNLADADLVTRFVDVSKGFGPIVRGI